MPDPISSTTDAARAGAVAFALRQIDYNQYQPQINTVTVALRDERWNLQEHNTKPEQRLAALNRVFDRAKAKGITDDGILWEAVRRFGAGTNVAQLRTDYHGHDPFKTDELKDQMGGFIGRGTPLQAKGNAGLEEMLKVLLK